MPEGTTLVCPQCQQADALSQGAKLPANGPVRIVRPAAPNIPPSQFGCLSVALVGIAAVATAAVLGALAELKAAPATSAIGDLRPGDTAVFTGVLVFMIAFAGYFGILVWRQARGDLMLKQRTAQWQQAVARYEQLEHCSRCNIVFLPGQSKPVRADQAELLFYET